MYWLISTPGANNYLAPNMISNNLPATEEWHDFDDERQLFFPSKTGKFRSHLIGLYNIDGEYVQTYYLSLCVGTGSSGFKIFSCEKDAQKFQNNQNKKWERYVNEVMRM